MELFREPIGQRLASTKCVVDTPSLIGVYQHKQESIDGLILERLRQGRGHLSFGTRDQYTPDINRLDD